MSNRKLFNKDEPSVLLTDGADDVQFLLTVPVAQKSGVVIPIKVLCAALLELDRDWPIADYDNKKAVWVLNDGVRTKRIGSHNYIIYLQAQLTAHTVVKLFWQAGWDTNVIAWEPHQKNKTLKALTA